MSTEKTYYCSSPALDWRLSGNDAVDGHLQPDPLLYSSNASLERIYRFVDTEKGLGIVPPRLKTTQKAGMADLGLKTMETINPAALIKEETATTGKAYSIGAAMMLPSTPSNRSPSEQKDTPMTPSNLARLMGNTTHASPSPSSKRKRDGQDVASPSLRGKNRSKWCEWEDKLMKDAIIAIVDKHMDWKYLCAQINQARQGEDPRSVESVRKHWLQTIKSKVLQA